MAGKYRYMKGPLPIDSISGKKLARREKELQKRTKSIEEQYKASIEEGKISNKLADND